MPIVKIVEVSMEVGHAINYKTRELHGSSLNGSLSIVQESEIGSCDSSVFVFFLDESDFDVVGQEPKLAFDFLSSVLTSIGCTFEETFTKISKWLGLMLLMVGLERKEFNPFLKELKENFT